LAALKNHGKSLGLVVQDLDEQEPAGHQDLMFLPSHSTVVQVALSPLGVVSPPSPSPVERAWRCPSRQ
jgi:hypothetical protein